MKNKKGFTLVEIIVSLVLILLVSGVIIFMVFNNKKEKEEKIVEVTKKIQEAAGVYLSINKEIDDSIEQNIIKGGNGYVIPLQTLYDEGYIGENHIKTLKENIENFNISKHYMLAAAFSNDPQCDNGQSTITIEASYALENSTNYYLCNFTTEKFYTFYNLDGGYFTDSTEQVQMFIKGSEITLEDSEVKKDDISNVKYEFNGWYKEKNCGGEKVTSLDNLDNNVVYACYKEIITDDGVPFSPLINYIINKSNLKIRPLITKDSCEEGFFVSLDNDGTTFFYRGDVKNNYIKYGKDQNGNDLIWRIVRINGDGSLRIILNQNVEYSLLDINENEIPIDSNGVKIHKIYPKNYDDVKDYGTVFYNWKMIQSDGYKYYEFDNVISKDKNGVFTLLFDRDQNLKLQISSDEAKTIYESVYNSSDKLYDTLLNYWMNNVVSLSGNLKIDNNFCDNSFYYERDDVPEEHYFLPNTNFICNNTIESPKSNYEYEGENKIVSKEISHLSYGEYLMGTNTNSSCELSPGFLYSDKPYILLNLSEIEHYSASAGGDNNLKQKFSGLLTKDILNYKKYKTDNHYLIRYDKNFKDNFYVKKYVYSNLYLYQFRPVINLKSNIEITGEGTEANPYVITS